MHTRYGLDGQVAVGHDAVLAIVMTTIVLFFSSFFPLTTHMVAGSLNSSLAQVTYGVVILCVTAANVVLHRMLIKDNPEVPGPSTAILGSNWCMAADVAIKLVGLALSATVFAPGMISAVLVTLLLIVIPPQLKE